MRTDGERQQISYLICATPRSGSNLLCEVLASTGVAGRPWEFFYAPVEAAKREEWKLSSFADYLAAVMKEGSTPNGVFGAKVMWFHVEGLAANLRQLPGNQGVSAWWRAWRSEPTVPPWRAAPRLTDLLATAIPNLRYIRITRRDTVSQAVSLLRALQTGIFLERAGDIQTPTGEPVFEFETIDYLLEHVVLAEDRAWQRYFESSGIEPFVVIYEELALDPDGVAAGIIDYLGIAAPRPLVFTERHLRRQSDDLSAEWVRQYRAMKGMPPDQR